MIPIGTIAFTIYPERGKNASFKTIVGRLTLGEARQVANDEHRMRGIPRKQLERETRNLIRRSIHHKAYSELGRAIFEARLDVLSSVSSPADFQKINSAFERLYEFVTYRPEISDEKDPKQI